MSNTKFGRLPNRFGAIVHFRTRKLRNPFLAKIYLGKDDNGKALYKTIGTYKTYMEAFEALSTANKTGLMPEDGLTFAEMYERLQKEMLAVPVNGRQLSKASVDGYRCAYQAVPHLHSKEFLSLTAPELQTAINVAGGSASKQAKIKLLFSKMYQYAAYLGLTDTNLADYLHVTAKSEPKRNPFTVDEVQQIWQMPPSRWRDCTLILLYTGMRIGELWTVHDVHKDYFRAGLKTEAGINRIIPIHPEIAEIFARSFPIGVQDNRRLIERWFYRHLPGHTPHDCRRTFVTRADECGMNPTACRQIVGHSSGDVHTVKYTIHHPEYLYNEMLKLTYSKNASESPTTDFNSKDGQLIG